MVLSRPGDGARVLQLARGGRARWSWWSALTLVLAAVLALPTLTVLASALVPPSPILGHLVETVLAGYLANTAGLVVGVGVGVLVVGVASAWLVTMCRFPTR